MGKAREREVSLMALSFAALALLAAVVLVVAAVKIGAETRSHQSGPLVTQDGSAPLERSILRP